MKTYTLVMQIEADDDVNPDQIREELYDAGSDVPFGFEITSVTEAADRSGEATGSSRIVTIKKDDAGSITIGDPDSGQTVETAPWTSEEAERYNRTGETPLARLHRENLARQWNSGADRDTEK